MNTLGAMNPEIKMYTVPITIRALKFASVYKIKTENGTYLIDAGMDAAGSDFLANNGVDFSEIDGILLTHLHIDHLGGGVVASEKYGVPLYIGKDDLEFILKMQNDVEGYAINDEKLLAMSGVPDPSSLAFRKENPVFAKLDEYVKLSINSFEKLPESKTGIGYLDTPGHSPGSTCFIPTGTDIIFTGDHILEKITPNISYYDGVTNFLGQYIDSLKKTALLHVNNAYPGHGGPFSNVKGRIESLLEHHTLRMEEIHKILEGKMMTAYDIACNMTWSRDRKLDSMNHMERKFAIGEAISHLRHMESIGMCSTVEKNDLILYKN